MIERLKEVINTKFQTQSNFANQLGVSKQVVTSYMQGRALPSIQTLIKLGLDYNVNLDWLLTGRGQREVSNDDTREVVKLKAQVDVLKELINNNQNR